MLAVSCFNSKQVLICTVDIKARNREFEKPIENKKSPTCLYQVNADHLIVGTLAGNFEIWNINQEQEKPTIVQVIDAHSASSKGISQIVKLENPSAMIIGDKSSDDC